MKIEVVQVTPTLPSSVQEVDQAPAIYFVQR